MERNQALREAAVTRLRPIMMTTTAMILGWCRWPCLWAQAPNGVLRWPRRYWRPDNFYPIDPGGGAGDLYPFDDLTNRRKKQPASQDIEVG